MLLLLKHKLITEPRTAGPERENSIWHLPCWVDRHTHKKRKCSKKHMGTYSHPAFYRSCLCISFSLCAFSQMMFYCPSVIKMILQKITYCESGERNIATGFPHLSRS